MDKNEHGFTQRIAYHSWAYLSCPCRDSRLTNSMLSEQKRQSAPFPYRTASSTYRPHRPHRRDLIVFLNPQIHGWDKGGERQTAFVPELALRGEAGKRT